MTEKVLIMSCEIARERLQDWFDRPGSPSLSPDVGEHVKDCADCRTFATRWNRIELQLQAMKEDGPTLSPNFALGLRGRMARPKPRFYLQLPIYTFRLATAGAAAVLALIAVVYLLGALKIISPAPADSILANLHLSGSNSPNK